MNYLRIRLILSFYKTFYVDKQTLIRTSHLREIIKHHRLLTRLKDSLIELSPDLTEQEINTKTKTTTTFVLRYNITLDAPTDVGCSTHSG